MAGCGVNARPDNLRPPAGQGPRAYRVVSTGALRCGHFKNGARLVQHDAAHRVSELERFKATSFPLVMVSPSMDRGVDLPGDLCRFIVVMKMPYPTWEAPANQAAHRILRWVAVVCRADHPQSDSSYRPRKPF